MDVQHLLCGLNLDRLRNSGFFKLTNNLNLPNIQMPSLNLNLPRPEWNLPNLPAIQTSLRQRIVAATNTNTPSRKHLPVGSGKHTVGCLDLMVDPTKKGTFMRLYYPTHPTDVFKREAQWPLWLPRKKYGKGYAYFRRYNTKVFGTLMNIIGGEVYVPVLWQAPVLDNAGKFPLILFSHGLGGNRTTYTTLCSDLASHGYIVAALEHRDGTASMTYCYRQQSQPEEEEPDNSDYRFLHRNHSFHEEHWLKYERQEVEDDFNIRNKQIHMRVEEIQRVLDIIESLNHGDDIQSMFGPQLDMAQFRNRIDIDRLAIVGHSFGAATAVAALIDKRIKVGVALDSWMLPLTDDIYNRVHQPVLMINSESFQWPANVKDMLKLHVNNQNVNANNALHRILLTLRGTCHQSHSDFQFIVPAKVGKVMAMRHNTEPAVAMDVSQRATLGFLAKHLNIPDQDHHEDILTGDHNLVILGTNLDLSESP